MVGTTDLKGDFVRANGGLGARRNVDYFPIHQDNQACSGHQGLPLGPQPGSAKCRHDAVRGGVAAILLEILAVHEVFPFSTAAQSS
jgi:hypothetical protein